MDLEFEWDLQKAEANSSKHGIAFEEARQVFADPAARIIVDPQLQTGELRYVAIGRADPERL